MATLVGWLVASWQQAFLWVALLLPDHHRFGSSINLFLVFFSLFSAMQRNPKQDNLAAQICRQSNLSARQFGGKINKNNLPSLALKRKQKNFVTPQRQLKRQL